MATAAHGRRLARPAQPAQRRRSRGTWQRLAQTLGDSLVEIACNIGAVASLPLAFLAAFADQVSNDVTLNVRDFDLLGSADLSTAVAQGHISARLNEVTSWLLTFFLRLMQRQLDGATAGQTFELAVPLPGANRYVLAQVRRC